MKSHTKFLSEYDMFRLLCTLALAAVFTATAAQAITLEEIMTNNLQARGGKDMIMKIKTMKITGTMETMGGEMTFTQYMKDNVKMRMDMSVQGMEIVQAFDGVAGWSKNPMAGGAAQRSSEAESKQARAQANMWGIFVNPEDQGYKLAYVGTEDLDGMTVYKVAVTDPEGETSNVYIDAITWLEVKMTRKFTMMGQEAEMDIFLSNYKDIGGVQFPMQMDMEMDGQEVMSMKRENVDVNTGITDDVFAFPGS